MTAPYMACGRMQLAAALILAGIVAASASAQVTLAPESPRWGETLTITADPSVWASENQRF